MHDLKVGLLSFIIPWKSVHISNYTKRSVLDTLILQQKPDDCPISICILDGVNVDIPEVEFVNSTGH